MTASRQALGLEAALEWLGTYEAEGPDGDTVSLREAVERVEEELQERGRHATAGEVARRFPDFPRDMVDGYFELERILETRDRQAQRRRDRGR